MKRTPLKRETSLRRTSGPARKGRTQKCERCPREFYVRPGEVGRRRFCSRTCMGFVSRAKRTCTVCGETFTTKKGFGPRKTCSTACRNEAKRRSKLGRKNPNYRNGNTSEKRRWRTARRDQCERRGCRSRDALRQHHVVYEQHVRKRGGDVFDPENSFTICWDCHNGHHHGADRRIHVDELSRVNLLFANRLLGAYAVDYFIRYYDGSRREIERRIEVALVDEALERTYDKGER